MFRRLLIGLPAVVMAVATIPAVAADIFDRHTCDVLQTVAAKSKPLAELSLDGAGKLKTLSSKIDSPCVVVKTDEGNWVKALVSWGFRKGPDKPIPVLVIERFVTYRFDRTNVTTAAGSNVMLFAGFSFDFDIGQVVPAQYGGDIRLDEAGLLKPHEKVEIFGVSGSQLEDEEPEQNDPNDHEGVLPRDFSGQWQVNVDGRWKGEWDLIIDDVGKCTGTYRSDESKSSYEVTGRISGAPHRLRLQLHLDNATQVFDAYLWTKDKAAMAGTTTLAERTFGFYALRAKKDAAGKPDAVKPDSDKPDGGRDGAAKSGAR